MRIFLQKWGNSLGIRIPKVFAESLKVHEGAELDISLENERIVIQPMKYSLEAMLQGMTDIQIHEETDTGPVTGKELW